jgi:hypothetical protein
LSSCHLFGLPPGITSRGQHHSLKRLVEFIDILGLCALSAQQNGAPIAP